MPYRCPPTPNRPRVGHQMLGIFASTSRQPCRPWPTADRSGPQSPGSRRRRCRPMISHVAQSMVNFSLRSSTRICNAYHSDRTSHHHVVVFSLLRHAGLLAIASLSPPGCAVTERTSACGRRHGRTGIAVLLGSACGVAAADGSRAGRHDHPCADHSRAAVTGEVTRVAFCAHAVGERSPDRFSLKETAG